nr:putative cytochrome c1 heme lyase [Quercus suber]POF16491.1 putative cytochrome c1 heme lyase [Quercus suber]
MRPVGSNTEEKCPVDPKTREKWLEAAKANGQQKPAHPTIPTITATTALHFSLDTGRWHSSPTGSNSSPAVKKPRIFRLSTDREISTIPRSLDRDPETLKPEERAAIPANSEKDTGHDAASGNWIYPSQDMFFNAMQRKGHAAKAEDMTSIVPIHNAVNERAWAEIKAWEKDRGSERCGGPKLVSFSGDSKALTPRARWNSMVGYQPPFDRHDWVVDRCGKKIDYVIDFYSGKDSGTPGKSLNFYLDVRPKLNSWEGVKTRALHAMGI